MRIKTPLYFEALPLHPPPRPLESLTSYLIRLAEVNKITTMSCLRKICLPGFNLSMAQNMRDYPFWPNQSFQAATNCPENILLKTTFYHLGRKFGIRDQQTLNVFLSNSLAKHLRYCPQCLRDQGYYHLTWRFLILQSCPKHACRLLSACASCGHTLPILAPSLQIGTCPYCNHDFSQATSEPVSEDEQSKLFQTAQDLVFLLTPHPCETINFEPLRTIGICFNELRPQQLTPREVSRKLGRDHKSIEFIEEGAEKSGIVKFHIYCDYAKFLSVTFRDVVIRALSFYYPSHRDLLSTNSCGRPDEEMFRQQAQ